MCLERGNHLSVPHIGVAKPPHAQVEDYSSQMATPFTMMRQPALEGYCAQVAIRTFCLILHFVESLTLLSYLRSGENKQRDWLLIGVTRSRDHPYHPETLLR